MDFLAVLWLPILVATVVLWILSFVAWVVSSHHIGDFKKLEAEDEVMNLIKEAEVGSGNYMFPYSGTNKEQNSKDYQARYMEGPRGTLNVYDVPNMGVNMGLTILYFLVTSLTIAYVTNVACPVADAETDFKKVFRVAGTIGVLTYASSPVLHRIWFKAKLWTDMLDGAVYGTALGLIYGLLWTYSAS